MSKVDNQNKQANSHMVSIRSLLRA